MASGMGRSILSRRGHAAGGRERAAGLVVTAGMSVLLIPPYGASGAAIASAIGYMAGGVVAWVTFIRVARSAIP